jgi:hypothetical protein
MEDNNFYNSLYNELWNAIIHYMIDIHSKTSKQKCYIIVAINTYKKKSNM